MINLLPDEVKRDIRAARMNVILLQYNFFTLLAMIVVVGLCLMFFVFLNVSHSSAAEASNQNKQAAQSLNDVMAAAEDYRKDLQTAKSIFDKSINFTEVVFAITRLVPKGVVLTQIDIKKDTFGQPVVFSAYAKSYEQATKLKENFQKSDLFTNVFLQNLSDASGNSQGGGTGNSDGEGEGEAASESQYPITFTISATLNKVVGLW